MKHNPYKVLIVSCWSLLGVCFILQLFGVNWFIASTDSKVFINICIFIDSKLWLRQLCTCIISTTLSTFTILAILKQRWFNTVQFCIFIPIMVFQAYANYFTPEYVTSAITVLIYIVLPIIWQRKYWYRGFIGFGLVCVFQLVSLFVKNIGGITLHNLPFLIGALLQIDSLIMVILYYLYSTKRKEV